MNNREDIEHVESAHDGARRNIVDAQSRHAEADSNYEIARQYVEDIQSDARSAEHKMESNYGLLEETKRALARIARQREQTDEWLSEKQEKVHNLEEKLTEANRRLENAKAKAAAKIDSEQIVRKRAAYDAARDEVIRLEEELARLSDGMTNAQETLSRALAAQSAAQSAYDTALNAYNTLGVGGKRRSLAAAEKEYKNARDGALDKAYVADGALRAIMLFERQEAELETCHDDANAHLTQSEGDLLEVSKALLDANEKGHSVERILELYDKALRIRDEAHVACAKVDQRLEEMKKALDAARQWAEDSAAALDEARRQMEEKRQAIELASEELEVASENDGDERARLDAAEAAFESAKRDVAAARSALDGNDEERISTLEASLADARARLEVATREHEMLASANARARKNVDDAQKVAIELNGKIERLAADIADVESRADALEERSNETEGVLADGSRVSLSSEHRQD